MMRRVDYSVVFLVSMIFLAQILVLATAQTAEEKIAALEERVSTLETQIADVREISYSVGFLALAIAVMIPLYPRFKQQTKPAAKK
jgi:hypothetical protein